MLELGCGTGHWTKHFEEKGYKITATDISDAMLETARKKGLKAELVRADAQALPFRDASFGLVTSITMLEFVDDLHAAVKEMRRILTNNGLLILGCLNRDSAIGKNKLNDPTFKDADFFTEQDFFTKFPGFGNVKIVKGVHLSPEFKIADGTEEEKKYEPAFFGVSMRRI